MKQTVVLLLLLLHAITSSAQSIDWILKVPRIPVGWQTGTTRVIEDSLRNRLLTLGWRRGSMLISTDDGSTWKGRYAMQSDVVGKNADLLVLPNGYYVYYGLTPWNQPIAVVSGDGGESWRRLTADPRVYTIGPHTSFAAYIAPDRLVAFDTARTGKLVTTDMGDTWTVFPTEPADSSDIGPAWHQAAPYVVYWRGSETWYRLDARADTQWVRTSIPSTVEHLVETRGAVVGLRDGTLMMAASFSDTLKTFTDWAEAGWPTWLNVPSNLARTLRVNDSIVYVIDHDGAVVDVRPSTGSVRIRHYDEDSSTNMGRRLYAASAHKDNVLAVFSEPARSDRPTGMFYMKEIGPVSGTVDERPSIRTKRTWMRLSPAASSASAPLTYVSFSERAGTSLVFMITETESGFREVVYSNLGGDWMHPSAVEVEDLAPMYLPITSTVTTASGALWLHTAFNHLIEMVDGRAVERRQYLADTIDWPYVPRATFAADGDRILLTGSALTLRDSMSVDGWLKRPDTVIAGQISFHRRIDAGMLAAGRDSLWLSFNDGKEWTYTSNDVKGMPAQRRGAFADAERVGDRVLLAALRGFDYIDSNDRRGVDRVGGILRSTDNGNSWTRVGAFPQEYTHVSRLLRVNDTTVLAIAARVSFDSVIIRQGGSRVPTVESSAMVRSLDQGQTWSVVATDARTGIPFPDFEPCLLYADQQRILATLHSGSLMMSVNAGASWAILDVAELADASIHALSIHRSGMLMAATSAGVGTLQLPSVTSVDDPAENQSTGLRIHARTASTLTTGQATVRITGIDGRIVMQQEVPAGHYSIDLSPLSRGTYGVELLLPSGVERRLFIR